MRAAWYGSWAISMTGAALLSAPALSRPNSVGQQKMELNRRIDADYPRLEALYHNLHAHPELSLQEEQTAARLARELREAGFEVTERVGSHGVVAVLQTGSGRTVLVRTDMDALPVVEQTGLAYASTVKARDREGKEVGVMHACGHDVHMTCLVGIARLLGGMRDRWRGTLVLIGQPAEEVGQGARAMLADGLFRRFPRPDYALALHTFPLPYDSGGYHEGPMMAGVDSVDIVVRGRGGHGAAPHQAVDPIVLAARIILDLQTLVSREVNPIEHAVVTVGSIHGGTKRNIIPDEVTLQLTVRSYKPEVRQQLLDGIERIARAASEGARAPAPTVRLLPEETSPPVVNDAPLTRRLMGRFRELLGSQHVIEIPPFMTGEDFAYFGREGIPSLFYALGIYPPEQMAEAARPGGKPVPFNHSPLYAPVPEPSIKTGTLTMSAAVLELLRR